MHRFEMLEEGRAKGPIKEIYLEIEHLFGSPFVGGLFRSLACHEDVLSTFWSKLKPNLETQWFLDFSTQLRNRADALAEATFEISDLYGWLWDHQFNREDIRRILYILETFHHIDPKYLLAAAALTAPVMGIEDLRIVRHRPVPISSQEPEFPTKIPRLTFEQAPHDVREDYFDMAEVFGCPLVPDEFLAFGEWPNFLKKLWSELKPAMRSTTFLNDAENMSAYAIEIAQELPHAIKIEANGVEIRMILETFLSLTARTTIAMAAVRQVLIDGERTARSVGRTL